MSSRYRELMGMAPPRLMRGGVVVAAAIVRLVTA